MNEQEEKNYQIDKEKRVDIITKSLQLAFNDLLQEQRKTILKSDESIKLFYQNNYLQYYLGRYIDITSDKYSFGDYHFNDAGFQFKWKNHKYDIKLECLTWSDVRKRLTA